MDPVSITNLALSLISSNIFSSVSEIIKRIGAKSIGLTQIIADLRKHYKAERLVLVLGAGVSMSHGIPNWNTLLQKLIIANITSSADEEKKANSALIAKVISEVFSPNPLISARYLSSFYQKESKDDPLAFTKAVRNILYEDLDPEIETDLIKEIREFCVAVGKSPNLDCLITYNYDDLLESSIQKLDLKIPFRSVYKTGINPRDDELAIFHVHGFLPRLALLDTSNKVTLSEDTYHQQYNDVYSWSNLVQINKFKDANCLFIGVSFTDPNLRRLLDIARIQRGDNKIHHYCFRKKYDIDDVKKAIANIFKKKRSKQKLSPEMLDENAKSLIEVMENYETKDFESFGVQVIWIKEFSEIPEILRQIRELDSRE